MKLIKIIYWLMVVVFLAAAAGPAKAGPPEIFTFPDEGYMDFDCGKYTVRYEWKGTDTYIVHWDQGFTNIHHNLRDSFSRTDGVGEVYTHVEQNTIKETNDGANVHGIFFHVVIPGYGSVFIVAGHYFVDYATGEFTLVGGNPNKNNIDPDSVCAAFAVE